MTARTISPSRPLWRQEDERAKQLMIAEECEAEHNLPQLTGSEKQVAWARTIRATAAKEIHEIFAAKNVDPRAEPVAKVMAYLFGQTDASYWIDRRTTSGFWLLDKAAKEMMAAGLAIKDDFRK